MRAYRFHPDVPRATGVRVWADGVEIDVLSTDSHPFATFEAPEGARVKVMFAGDAAKAIVRPRSRRIEAETIDGGIEFRLDQPEKLCVELPDQDDLYLWVNGLESGPGDATHVFEEGTLTDVGVLEVSGDVYLAGGSVVRGALRGTNRPGLHISGPGVLDGESPGPWCRFVVLDGCPNAVVEDMAMVRPRGWMLTLANCDGAEVRGIKQIGTIVGSDGIDVVGSSHVRIRDCFLRNGDDCIVVKSLNMREGPDAARDVTDLLAERCTLLNYRGGNAIEVGHELRCESVRDLVFRDVDIVCVHNHGAALSIHNGDRALVADVVFENIRVEHHYDKLIDFRVIRSMWSRDELRGQVRNVVVRGLAVEEIVYQEGYTVSLIGGWDDAHTVEGVRLEAITYGGRPVRNADDLWLFTRHASGIEFA